MERTFTPVRNRNMTGPNMIFSQMWYDALEIAREKLIDALQIDKWEENGQRN